MEQSTQRSLLSFLRRHGYGWGLLLVFIFSLALRFWSLDRFNQLVFDEIYYVRYGVDYLAGRSLFDAHPPLGKYLIAAGIWLGDHLLFAHLSTDQHLFNDATGRLLSPYSYRWLNAVVGSTIPLLVAGIARQLTGQKLVGLLAAVLIALDGFFLVESRFGLLHVYLVAFGLLGNWCWLKAHSATAQQRWRWLLAAGVAFGACCSVKWNGLGYWFAPVGLSLASWLRMRWAKQLNRPKAQGNRGRFAQASPLQILLFLVVIPGLVYTLLWLPHLQLNPEVGLFELHGQILGFHQGDVVAGADSHDYCSPWWSWPLMIRPIAYALSRGGEPAVYFPVYALGNPLLWWGGVGAIASVLLLLLARFRSRLGELFGLSFVGRRLASGLAGFPTGVGIYLLLSYASNWLPWAFVDRCTFVYHYLGGLVFATATLGWGLGWAWRRGGEWRWGTVGVVGFVAIAFWFWLPVWLGLPLSEQAFRLRLLLPSWP